MSKFVLTIEDITTEEYRAEIEIDSPGSINNEAANSKAQQTAISVALYLKKIGINIKVPCIEFLDTGKNQNKIS